MNREFITLEKTVSTNNDMKEKIYNSENKVFSVISAKIQTGGRGRLGKSFFSPNGGVYFSISYPLSGEENNISFLTLLTGLCVSEELDSLCGVKTQIKWPNDIYLNGKKLVGILCELVGDKKLTAVAGIGINTGMHKEDIPPELKNKITSLRIENAVVPDNNELIKNITARLDRAVYEKKLLCKKDDTAIKKIREKSFSIGKRAEISTVGFEMDGYVKTIDPDGAIRIILDNGDEIRKI